MAAGKAVVATGWSGNTDFMTPDDSVLVAWTLIPVRDPQGLYEGGRWAEPDVADAARQLKPLLADARTRAALGERAAATIREQLDPLRIGRQALEWLKPHRQ
jgi:glycosyltransferase involved in cell wall biosynthesis